LGSYELFQRRAPLHCRSGFGTRCCAGFRPGITGPW
jgi:hypothetical protein